MSCDEHTFCDGCWQVKFPDKEPKREKAKDPLRPYKTCCVCGEKSASGIDSKCNMTDKLITVLDSWVKLGCTAMHNKTHSR